MQANTNLALISEKPRSRLTFLDVLKWYINHLAEECPPKKDQINKVYRNLYQHHMYAWLPRPYQSLSSSISSSSPPPLYNERSHPRQFYVKVWQYHWLNTEHYGVVFRGFHRCMAPMDCLCVCIESFPVLDSIPVKWNAGCEMLYEHVP